jgi:hypothetical protein
VFDRQELREAVEIGARAYGLIRWLGRSVDRGTLPFNHAHEYASEAAAAEDWLVRYYGMFPGRFRPRATSGPGLARFARYFATYLTTSFELVAEPGLEVRPACGPCFCCTYLAPASHLRTRRVTSADKKRAAELKLDYLQQQALDRDLALPGSALEAIATAPETSEQVALLGYTVELLARCAGRSSGPAALALWRQFAWTRAGSPKHDFELSAELILEAEEQVGRAIAAAAEK